MPDKIAFAMGTILATTPLPQRITPRQSPAQTLESNVARITDEVNFYHQLLSWCLFSCKEEQRRAIESLRKEVDCLRDNELPALSDNLYRLVNDARDRETKLDIQLSAMQVQHYFFYIDGVFQALKSKIQHGFSGFTHVRIW